MLFFVYFYIITFIAGFITGLAIELNGGDVDNLSDDAGQLIAIVAFLINVALVFVAGKKIYFHVVNKPENEIVPAAENQQVQ